MNPVCTAGWQQCEVLPWNINKTVDNQERGTDVTWPRPGPACIITRSTLTPPVISSQSCVSVYLLSICKHIYLQCISIIYLQAYLPTVYIYYLSASISPVFAPRHDADFMWARPSPAGVGSAVVALGNKELTVSCMHSAPPHHQPPERPHCSAACRSQVLQAGPRQ